MTPCRWDFISDNRADFGVKRICRVLGVSRAGCCRHLATEQARAGRQAGEKRTVAEIRAIHAEHHGVCGAPRVHAGLRARGHRIDRKRVTRLMRVNHIVGRHLRKKKRTTITDRAAPPVPDPVMRDFTADRLNTRWCGRHHLHTCRHDVALLRHGDRHLSAAGGGPADRRPPAHLAGHRRDRDGRGRPRQPGERRRFPTDRGAQYSAAAFVDVCRRHGIRCSMGRTGSSCDNALAESFFQDLKRELLHRCRWTSKAQTRLELFRWLSYYNRRRRHCALGYLTPAEFEQQLITTRTLSLIA
ncbi:integrase core domain-containing protein [Streptomyces sp. NPDC005876]|uniref:integrase core domain-containing protein n=1 Tax=unclassified Streptomyces TaxID=2593676 RepID=UPI0033CC569C